ncbi:MAG: hypothetical protein ACLRWQ_20845 [Flavonifractor plautii]
MSSFTFWDGAAEQQGHHAPTSSVVPVQGDISTYRWMNGKDFGSYQPSARARSTCCVAAIIAYNEKNWLATSGHRRFSGQHEAAQCFNAEITDDTANHRHQRATTRRRRCRAWCPPSPSRPPPPVSTRPTLSLRGWASPTRRSCWWSTTRMRQHPRG